MGFPGFAAGQQLGEQNLERRRELEDEKRKGLLKTLLEDAATPQDKVAVYDAVYHKDPGVLKQHVENLTRRLTGKQPQPVVSPQQAQAGRVAALVPRLQTPAQQNVGAYQEYIKAGFSPEQAAQMIGVRQPAPKLVNLLSPDKKTVQTVDVNDPAARGLIQQGWTLQPTGSSRPVPGYSEALNLSDAQSLARSQGQTYIGKDGQAWDLTALPPGAVLVPMFTNQGNYWTVATDKGRYETAGNQRLLEPAVGGPNPNAPSIGVARVPTTGTHQVPGMNPGEKITLTSTSTPQTPGATAIPSVAPAPKIQQQLPSAQPQGSASAGPAPKKAASAKGKASKVAPLTPATQTVIGAPPPPFAPGTMLSQGRNAEPVVASMNTVAAQVFGGNGEPPIWTNAWMFDNPQLRTAMNRALTLNALAIPGTEDDPSFTQTLGTALGVTGWSQEQIEQANVQARQQLQQLGGDKALEMFARMAGLQEDLSALRSATKGSAAQGSIRTLVRAAPVYNVASSKNFRDQLGVTLNTAAAAMSGYPAINPQYLEWWKKGAQAARGAQPAPQSKQSTGDPAVDQFLMSFPNAPTATQSR